RTFQQEARKVIRSIWHEFAAAEPDKQIEILALDFLDRGAFGGFGERGMCEAERRSIAAQGGKFGQKRRIGRPHQQGGWERIFAGPGNVDVVDIACSCTIQIWPKDRSINTGCSFN